MNQNAAPHRPCFPSHQTQPGRLLAALLRNKKVDPLMSWHLLGIYRLADSVFQLRSAGWPIENIGLEVKNRFGENCHVACYLLPDHVINEVGWIGLSFAEWVEMHPPKAKGALQACRVMQSIPNQTPAVSVSK